MGLNVFEELLEKVGEDLKYFGDDYSSENDKKSIKENCYSLYDEINDIKAIDDSQEIFTDAQMEKFYNILEPYNNQIPIIDQFPNEEQNNIIIKKDEQSVQNNIIKQNQFEIFSHAKNCFNAYADSSITNDNFIKSTFSEEFLWFLLENIDDPNSSNNILFNIERKNNIGKRYNIDEDKKISYETNTKKYSMNGQVLMELLESIVKDDTYFDINYEDFKKTYNIERDDINKNFIQNKAKKISKQIKKRIYLNMLLYLYYL